MAERERGGSEHVVKAGRAAARAAARSTASRLLKGAVAGKLAPYLFGAGAILAVCLSVLFVMAGAFQQGATGRPPCQAGTPSGGIALASDGGKAAAAYARARGGRVSFALADSHGRSLVGVNPDSRFHSASLTKAMVLVARLRTLHGRSPSRGERALMAAMIEQSDNDAANRVLRLAGIAAIRELARSAGMANLVLRTDDPVYRLGNSLVTAGDQARFFAQLDTLLPSTTSAFAFGLLEGVEEGHWGILDADLGDAIATKAGWRQEASGGWTVVQGAQLTAGDRTLGLAVLTDANESQHYGERSITGVAKRLLTRADLAATPAGAQGVTLVAGGPGTVVGASEFGGPQDPGTGSTGAYQDPKGGDWDLERHPDSYAELGGLTRQTATLLGGLPNMQPLRVTYQRRAAVLYKRDFGHGGGPVRGHVRAIDLWYKAAAALRFSGTDLVTIAKVPPGGAGALTGTTDPVAAGASSDACPAATDSAAAPLTPGERATILPDGRATSPATAPTEVKAIIAAGNQINGKPYVYGGCHGSIAKICASYDCSSAVSYLLYMARLHGPTASVSGDFDGWRQPGNGRWITTASNSGHIYMYVAGIRFDTHQYGARDYGPNKGIGWHPGRRPDSGFHLRHPSGL